LDGADEGCETGDGGSAVVDGGLDLRDAEQAPIFVGYSSFSVYDGTLHSPLHSSRDLPMTS
jgi:hypothetical protein